MSQESLEIFVSHVSFGHKSPTLAIEFAPFVGKLKAKSRKRWTKWAKFLFKSIGFLDHRSRPVDIQPCPWSKQQSTPSELNKMDATKVENGPLLS